MRSWRAPVLFALSGAALLAVAAASVWADRMLATPLDWPLRNAERQGVRAEVHIRERLAYYLAVSVENGATPVEHMRELLADSTAARRVAPVQLRWTLRGQNGGVVAAGARLEPASPDALSGWMRNPHPEVTHYTGGSERVVVHDLVLAPGVYSFEADVAVPDAELRAHEARLVLSYGIKDTDSPRVGLAWWVMLLRWPAAFVLVLVVLASGVWWTSGRRAAPSTSSNRRLPSGP